MTLTRFSRIAPSAVAAVLCLAACQGVVGGTDGAAPDRPFFDRGPTPDSAPPADQRATVDLPVDPGDPCAGACAGDMLCIAGVCHRQCDQPDPACNPKVEACAEDEACQPATDFADVCYPAQGAEGSPCGEGSGTRCRGGTLCVILESGTRCLGLCQYGCEGGQCLPTRTGCQVCVK